MIALCYDSITSRKKFIKFLLSDSCLLESGEGPSSNWSSNIKCVLSKLIKFYSRKTIRKPKVNQGFSDNFRGNRGLINSLKFA